MLEALMYSATGNPELEGTQGARQRAQQSRHRGFSTGPGQAQSRYHRDGDEHELRGGLAELQPAP
jgi:hypothetical protein